MTGFFGSWGLFLDHVSRFKLTALRLKQKEKTDIHGSSMYDVTILVSFSRNGYCVNKNTLADSAVREEEVCFLATVGSAP